MVELGYKVIKGLNNLRHCMSDVLNGDYTTQSVLLICCITQLGSTTDVTTTLRHTGHLTTLYDGPPYRSVFHVTQTDPEPP
jgi:hypothetical protein